MIKWTLYIVFFLLACDIAAQSTTPTDTTKASAPTIAQPVLIDTTKLVAPNTQATTPSTTTIQPIPTQTMAAITVVENNKHKRFKKPKNPYKKPDFKVENKEITKLYRDTFERKKEIVLQNKRYRIYNNYLVVGIGKCYNSGWQEFDLCTAFDFNFHAAKNYFQIGGNLVGPALWNNNTLQFHAGWGYRFERCNYQLSAYGGVSFSDGYRLLQSGVDSTKVRSNNLGGYISLQYLYKLKFDYGVGVSTFFDVNAKQALIGIKLDIFFSGAYKGFKRRNYAKEDEKYQVP
jgi:hypothetical protein